MHLTCCCYLMSTSKSPHLSAALCNYNPRPAARRRHPSRRQPRHHPRPRKQLATHAEHCLLRMHRRPWLVDCRGSPSRAGPRSDCCWPPRCPPPEPVAPLPTPLAAARAHRGARRAAPVRRLAVDCTATCYGNFYDGCFKKATDCCTVVCADAGGTSAQKTCSAECKAPLPSPSPPPPSPPPPSPPPPSPPPPSLSPP